MIELAKQHWPALILLLAALAAAVAALTLRKSSLRAWLLAVAALALPALGDLASLLPLPDWNINQIVYWIMIAAVAILVLKLILLILLTTWSHSLAFVLASILMFGLGILLLPAIATFGNETLALTAQIQLLHSTWLLFLLLLVWSALALIILPCNASQLLGALSGWVPGRRNGMFFAVYYLVAAPLVFGIVATRYPDRFGWEMSWQFSMVVCAGCSLASFAALVWVLSRTFSASESERHQLLFAGYCVLSMIPIPWILLVGWWYLLTPDANLWIWTLALWSLMALLLLPWVTIGAWRAGRLLHAVPLRVVIFVSGCALFLTLAGLFAWWFVAAVFAETLDVARWTALGLFVFFLAVILPWLIWPGMRSLTGLGPARKWTAICLRCLGVAFVIVAIAGPHARRQSENLTVLFLWDQSRSVPREMKGKEDLQAQRIRDFINHSVAQRGSGHELDRVGLIVFGRRPHLELPPGQVPELNLRKIISKVDSNYTDIGAALKLSLASFPEGAGKRVVLISDGNENLGDAIEQAKIAKVNGVQIDVVQLAGKRDKQNEVLVERVDVPPIAEENRKLPLWVVLYNHHPKPVVGDLTLSRKRLVIKQSKQGVEVEPIEEQFKKARIVLRPKRNFRRFPQPPTGKGESYIYKATFEPIGLAGDNYQNNEAWAMVMTQGRRTVLLVEPKVGEHRLLAERLRKAKSGITVLSITPEKLPQNPKNLTPFLSKFDSIILANVLADQFTEKQQEVIRDNTQHGCGLVMIGGPHGFGAGNWRGTEVEKALPVTCDLKTKRVEGMTGLVLIMHGSEMRRGNFWQKKIAKLAIQKLSAADWVGILNYDWGKGHRWHVKFQRIGENRAAIYRQLDSLSPGDMPDAEPCLTMARDALSKKSLKLAARHIVFISDGDHWSRHPPKNERPPQYLYKKTETLLRDIKKRKITCTTICITSHGNESVQAMRAAATLAGGRSYHVKDPRRLPAIYIKEVRLVSKSFLYEKRFQPRLIDEAGPTRDLPGGVAALHGFVRTTARNAATVSILSPKFGKDAAYPIFAYWNYGLGKALAFTSDARTRKGFRGWDREWADSTVYTKFWQQVVEESLRAVERGRNLTVNTEHKNGKLRITITARDDKNRPLTNVKFKAALTDPKRKNADKMPDIKFEQINAGVYQAEVKAEEVGAYVVNARARWTDAMGKTIQDGVRAGVIVPYSPEFADLSSHTALLKRIAGITGGRFFLDSEENLGRAAASGAIFRAPTTPHLNHQPIWIWFVLLAALCLAGDVAIRRVSFDVAKGWAKFQEVWSRLRGRPALVEGPQFLDRLRTRKSRIGDEIEKVRAARRFEAGPEPLERVPDADDVAARPAVERKPQAKPQVAPEPEQDPADYASRLLRAKRKVWKDRDNK